MCFNIKISSNLVKSKNSPFLAILSDTLQKNSENFESDNIDARRLAHSSFRNLCSNFFKTHVDLSDTFKILGPSPVQSWMIQNRDTQKSCFLTTFLEKIIVLTHFDPINTPKCYTWLESYGSHRSDRLAPTQQS